MNRGEVVALDRMWRLAQTWYGDRLDPSWRRPEVEQLQAKLDAVGLVASFWQLEA